MTVSYADELAFHRAGAADKPLSVPERGQPPRHVLDVVDVVVAESIGEPTLVQRDALAEALPLEEEAGERDR